jgi:predicted nucleic acid-binding protein
LKRREFIDRVTQHQFAYAIATGAFREFNEAAEVRERAAEAVSKQLDRGADHVDAEMLRAMRDHRNALRSERAAEGKLRLSPR